MGRLVRDSELLACTVRILYYLFTNQPRFFLFTAASKIYKIRCSSLGRTGLVASICLRFLRDTKEPRVNVLAPLNQPLLSRPRPL